MNQQKDLIQVQMAIPVIDSSVILQPLSCEIAQASLVCVLGQHIDHLNAYMEMLAGINEPDTGVISHSSGLLNKPHYSEISYIYHDSTLLSILNGIDNVKVPALYHQQQSIQAIDDEVETLLAELEFEEDHKVLPAFMGTLQKRFLLIVRAIMLKPSVLFIENPFMDLDREQVRIFGKYLVKLVKQRKITIITSNVNLDFVQNYADQILYLTETDIQVFKQREAFTSYINRMKPR